MTSPEVLDDSVADIGIVERKLLRLSYIPTG